MSHYPVAWRRLALESFSSHFPVAWRRLAFPVHGGEAGALNVPFPRSMEETGFPSPWRGRRGTETQLNPTANSDEKGQCPGEPGCQQADDYNQGPGSERAGLSQNSAPLPSLAREQVRETNRTVSRGQADPLNSPPLFLFSQTQFSQIHPGSYSLVHTVANHFAMEKRKQVLLLWFQIQVGPSLFWLVYFLVNRPS